MGSFSKNISSDLYPSKTGANVMDEMANRASKVALDARMKTAHSNRHIDVEPAPKLSAPDVLLILERISPPGFGRGAR